VDNRNTFINCPFDSNYRPVRDALVFAVHDCGYVARSALEYGDSSQVRIDRIYQLIRESRFAIHDLSRTQLDSSSQLPRFNMPLELGIFLGAKHFGGRDHQQKACLVLIKKPYAYQKYLSDISGQDVEAHNNAQGRAIAAVRDWLRGVSKVQMPGPEEMIRRYRMFRRKLPEVCQKWKLRPDRLSWNDYASVAGEWLQLNRWFD